MFSQLFRHYSSRRHDTQKWKKLMSWKWLFIIYASSKEGSKSRKVRFIFVCGPEWFKSCKSLWIARFSHVIHSVSRLTKGDDSYQMFVGQITSKPCFEIQHRNYFDFKISREFFFFFGDRQIFRFSGFPMYIKIPNFIWLATHRISLS